MALKHVHTAVPDEIIQSAFWNSDHTGEITDANHGVRTKANAHAHTHLSGVTADLHHAQSHNAASHSDITSTGAQIDDAVSKKHTQNTDTSLGAQSQDLDMNTHKIVGVVDPTANQEAATKKYVDDSAGNGVAPPIGSVLSWLKTYANTPALPDGWVECNGQTLSDAESVYNGQVIPNLNGANRFLRGNATSGGTGGSETHFHDILDDTLGCDDDRPSVDYVSGTYSLPEEAHIHENNIETYPTSTLPTYYHVVWIMRVK